MRRVVLGLFLMLISSTLSAQDEWELTETLELPDDAFSFNYPEGYTLTAAEDGFLLAPGWEPIRDASVMMAAPTPIKRAYFMTESEDDAALAMDADWETDPEGTVIYLLVSPLADWGIDDPQQSVYDISTSVCDILGMSTFSRTPMPLMGRLAITCEGLILTEGRSAINLIWLDDGNVYVLGVEAPGIRTIPEEDTYVIALAETFKSTPKVPLDDTISLSTAGFTIAVPSAWQITEEDSGFSVIEDTSGTPVLESDGMMVVNLALPREEMAVMYGLEDLTADDAQTTYFEAFFAISDPVISEMVLAGQPALSYSGRSSTLRIWVDVTIVIFDTNVEAFIHFAPSAELLEMHEPTFHAMLQSIAPASQAPDGEA